MCVCVRVGGGGEVLPVFAKGGNFLRFHVLFSGHNLNQCLLLMDESNLFSKS